MRKLRIVFASLVSFVIIAVFAFEAFASMYLSLDIKGEVYYFVKDIGAKIWSSYSITSSTEAYSEKYTNLELSGDNIKAEDIEVNETTGNVYYIHGASDEITGMTIDLGRIDVPVGYTFTLYVFMKNTGPRDIIPSQTSIYQNGAVSVTEKDYLFDMSEIAETNDPYSVKSGATSLKNYLTSIDGLISNSQASVYDTGMESLEVGDVYLKRITFTASTEAASSTFSVHFGFTADITSFSENILTVYQEINQTTTDWVKYGYNSTLDYKAAKIENNSLSALASAVNGADANGNADISNLGLVETDLDQYYTADDYFNAVVYKDIDLVNIDIRTGEPIGKLSDVNYSFEWYGGTVTLPSGTTLASGRVLDTEETFTVDVYTYYPTFYIRRWLKGTKQYISISDEEFVGAVKIDNFYTATFESTIFNPNGNVATNSKGKMIPRSYVYDHAPLTNGSSRFIHDYYYNNGTTVDFYYGTTNQINMMDWAKNLTTDWNSANMTSVSGYLPNGRLAQGENYVAYVYQYLYLIKYANNNSQETVGYGNTHTASLYGSSVKSKTPSGIEITTGGDVQYYEAEKGGGVIGCYNSTSQNDEYKHTTNAMAYGYDYASYTDTLSNNSGSKQGLYANQFLTYNTGSERVLLDGYVGSDKYTSVFCLGQANPWGNIWTWVFGSAVIGDGSNIKLYTTFDNYNGSNWYMLDAASTAESLSTGAYNYVGVSYNLPTSSGYFNSLGVSSITSSSGLEMLVGVPDKSSGTASETTGLCDYYYSGSVGNYKSITYGVLKGGHTGDVNAGLFGSAFVNTLTYAHIHVGFRLSLAP